jgi:antitoxin component YwqK of YwqJK toxin-antitoxin module
LFLTFVIPLLISACVSKNSNGYKNGRQHGRWIIYTDTSHSLILTAGKFKNGIPVGKWTYNTPGGVLDRVEVYRGEKIRIRHYHSNGQLHFKGRARLITDEKKLHFFYYGEWNYYDADGRPDKKAYYENGKLVKEKFLFRKNATANDTLIAELKSLDLDFTKYRDTLLRTADVKGKDSEAYKKIKRLYESNDSLIMNRVENIIQKHGYPTKAQVGENNSVLFYIISSASWQVKEKYFQMLMDACGKGEISLKDMAYFEDKMLIGKEGCQLFGTQSKVLNGKLWYYPVKNLAGMNERRIRAGLEAVNLLEFDEKQH